MSERTTTTGIAFRHVEMRILSNLHFGNGLGATRIWT
jgi:hypothetical protein